MFKLIKKEIETDSLSRVEDLIDQANRAEFTHLQYETKENLFEGNLTYCNDYFTYKGFLKAIKENLHKLEFIDGFAVYHLIKLKMDEIPKPYDIQELLNTIKQQENEIKILRGVIDKGQFFDIRELDKYVLLEPVIGERMFNGLKYNLYEIKEPEKNPHGYGYTIQNDGYMNSMFGLPCTAGKFPLTKGCGNCGHVVGNSHIGYKAVHITPFKLIQLQICHIFRYIDSHDRLRPRHGNQCYVDMIWNEDAFPQHGGTLSPPHPHFERGAKSWYPQVLKTQHIDLFIAWFQYNIHVLYRRYIKVVYGSTLRIYVSIDRAQPEESIWKVGGDGPLLV